MKINAKGYWENNTAEGHGVDKGLAQALLQFFWSEHETLHDIITVIDVGCGNGFYTNYLNSIRGPIICHGYDGNPNTSYIAGVACGVYDFTQDATILGKHDWVLSLEVGEHIPPEYEDIFINNLHKLNREGIILSWAIEGQGGDGHINCHNNDYIIDKIKKLDYVYLEGSTHWLRNSVATYPKPCYWFRDTLMVFKRLK